MAAAQNTEQHVLISTKHAHAMKINNPPSVQKARVCDTVPDEAGAQFKGRAIELEPFSCFYYQYAHRLHDAVTDSVPCHPSLDFCQLLSTDGPCVKRRKIQFSHKAVLGLIKNGVRGLIQILDISL